MDCFTLDAHKKYYISSIEVNYMHEALPGEIIQLYTDTSSIKDNFIYVEGINEDTSSTIFKAQITIE
jgi:hypothetical protein